jgi:hypothetical protein
MSDLNLFMDTLKKMGMSYTAFTPEIFVNHKPAFHEVRVTCDRTATKFGFFFDQAGKYIGKLEKPS